MSVTKTLVQHHPTTTTTTTTMMNNSARRFLLPSDGEDMGLVMRLDSKLEPGLMRAHGGSTPVPAKLCGQTKAVATWALFTWTSQIQKVSDSVQRLLIRLLPVMLYMSLLVSLLQAGAVIYLLARTALPLGVWFLLGCIAIMCYFYMTTIHCRSVAVSTVTSAITITSRRLSQSSSSSASLSPSASDSKLL